MTIGPLLFAAFSELKNASRGIISGTKLEYIADLINKYAIYSAIAQIGSLIGGFAAVVAIITQTGIIWSLYLKINEELGISSSKNVIKFVASAMLTNMVGQAGANIIAIVATWLIGLIPIFNVVAITAEIIFAYVIVYASALIYLKVLTNFFKAKGDFQLDESDETKDIIKQVVKDTDISSIIKEGRKAFKEAKDNGEIDYAMNHPQCYNCGAKITKEQTFCHQCKTKLK